MKRLATSVMAAAASALFLFALVASPLTGLGSDFTAYGSGSVNTNPDRDIIDLTVYGSGSVNTNPDRDIID